MKPGQVLTASGALDLFPLFAHQGGWDEIAIVAAPLVLIASLLFIANRRVNAKLAERGEPIAERGEPIAERGEPDAPHPS